LLRVFHNPSPTERKWITQINDFKQQKNGAATLWDRPQLLLALLPHLMTFTFHVLAIRGSVGLVHNNRSFILASEQNVAQAIQQMLAKTGAVPQASRQMQLSYC
jgi:hypothetical protein